MKPVCVALLLILPAIALAQGNQKQIPNGRYEQQTQQRPNGGVGQYGNIATLPARDERRPGGVVAVPLPARVPPKNTYQARDPPPRFVPGEHSKPYRPNQQQQKPAPAPYGNQQQRVKDDIPRQQQQQNYRG